MSAPRLVIGGDGTIGRALVTAWRSAGIETYATTRRRGSGGEHGEATIHFDLAANEARWRSHWSPGAAVICAGIASLAECRRSPVATRSINVDKVAELASTLVHEHDVHVIYLSTNLVFDGEVMSRSASDGRCPQTEYGRQKAAAESRLEALPGVAIVRLTKVVHPGLPLFANWQASLRAGRAIAAHVDQQLAPVQLDTVVAGLTKIVEQRAPGVWQFSGPEDVSYLSVARHIAKRLNQSEGLVTESRASDAADSEHIPRHTTLDSSAARSQLGLRFPNTLEIVDALVD